MKTTEAEKLDALNNIKEWAGKCKNKELHAQVTHVSASGMSRHIRYIAITKKGETYFLSYAFAVALGYHYNADDDSITVSGCGMDMIFNTLYNINGIAMNRKLVRTSKNKTEHDLRYSGIVNTSYRGI